MPKKKPTDTLGKRQKELNAKVNQAFVNKVDFNEIKETSETSDLDRLFKIDVAAKYMNTDYIIEVLKSGDSLYVTRALNKCLWLYDEDHIHIMNPEFLNNNVFPFISNKMKKKLLTEVSKHARTEERAVDFYYYCMKIKLNNIAFKFLLFTGEEFKQDLMIHHNKAPFNEVMNRDINYLKHLIGRSFILLEAFFTMLPESKHDLILKFKYMYAISNNKYVEFLEKYLVAKKLSRSMQFDLKLSNDIMTKHKERVLANPCFYEPLVDEDIFAKHTTADDAKLLAVALLPTTSEKFWMYFYQNYKYILKKIPHEDIYPFIKKIFNDRYPESEFEMTYEFYNQKYHQYMTLEEKEELALRHLKSEKQILGVGCDYLWYQYVSFDVSFEAVKNMILVTKEPEKRLDMINVLVKSARNDRELEKLFVYYDKRHSNEVRSDRDNFLKTVITHQNVFEFDEACWAAFYKLLLNMELYNVLDFEVSNQIYKTVTLLYHILHKLQMNEGVIEYLLLHFRTRYIFEHLSKLNHERHEAIHCYLFKYYMDQIDKFKDQQFTPDVSARLKIYFTNITDLLSKFREENSKPERPKSVYNQPRKKRIVDNRISDRELIRRLKTDTDLIKCFDLNNFTTSNVRTTNFLKKLKIYYSEDVAKIYLKFFEDLVTENNSLQSIATGVFGIFQLADEKRKVDLMNEYVPRDSKIDHSVTGPSELRIQKAICRFACYSRPPLPLDSVRMYLKGDYVKFCYSMFDMYLAHLPISMCVQFVESIIDAPVSIQKQGIRLAFKCLNSENLKKNISKIWYNTKNVSLRGIIYKTLYEKLRTEGDKELFSLLKGFTLTLHQDDEDEIFGLPQGGVLPDEYRGHHDEALWHAVSKFNNKQPNINRKIDVINRMHIDMYLLNEEFVRTVVDDHLKFMLTEKNLHLNYSEDEISNLCVVKWKLTARYIIHFATFATEAPIKYAKVAEDIVDKCVKLWNEEYRDINHFQVLCSELVGYLKEESFVIYHEVQNYTTVLPVFESILNRLTKELPLHDIYMLVWDLRLTIINRREIQAEKIYLNNSNAWTEIIPKMSISFGREVGKLVIEFIESKTYLTSFIPNITDAVRNTAQFILFSLNKFDVPEADLTKVLLFVASGLIENEFPETYIIAIKLLPDLRSSECTSVLFDGIIEKIKNYPDLEVKSVYTIKYRKRKLHAIDPPPAEVYAARASGRGRMGFRKKLKSRRFRKFY